MTATDRTPTPHGVDLATLDDGQLRALGDDVDALLRTRWRMAAAAVQAEQIAVQYRTDLEATLPPLKAGEHRPYVQPSGAHDAYPKGAIVTEGGKVWRSKIANNVWRPGSPGAEDLWEDVTGGAACPEPIPDAAAWKAGEAVAAGDLRTHGGATYAVVQPHTTQAGWEPPAVPALWKKV